MRYRKLDAAGDYVFGQGSANFFVDQPEAVAQYLRTRFLLMQGEWFLDVNEGTPYSTQILGENTRPFFDRAIKDRILQTPGVDSIASYTSSLVGRKLSVQAVVNTIFGGAAPFGATVQIPTIGGRVIVSSDTGLVITDDQGRPIMES